MFVWKEINYGYMTDSEKRLLVSEVNLLRELRHPHIVRYYDRCIDKSRTTIYIIMEYCEGGDLAQLIHKTKRDGKPLDEEFIWKIFLQIVEALKLCHLRSANGKAILHRDIKPANIFLDSNQNIKLGDFGLARVLNHASSFAKSFVGTPYYMSPEQMNNHSYDEKSDIWSLGCLMYELCTLARPFTGANQRELAVRIRGGHVRRIPSQYSDRLQEIIQRMLSVEVNLRPDIQELYAAIVLVVPSSGSGNSTKSNSISNTPENKENRHNKMSELRALEDRLAWKERSLRLKERQLQEKEKDLKVKDQRLVLKEKLLEERQMRCDLPLRQLQIRNHVGKESPGAEDIQHRIVPKGCCVRSPIQQYCRRASEPSICNLLSPVITPPCVRLLRD